MTQALFNIVPLSIFQSVFFSNSAVKAAINDFWTLGGRKNDSDHTTLIYNVVMANIAIYCPNTSSSRYKAMSAFMWSDVCGYLLSSINSFYGLVNSLRKIAVCSAAKRWICLWFGCYVEYESCSWGKPTENYHQICSCLQFYIAFKPSSQCTAHSFGFVR